MEQSNTSFQMLSSLYLSNFYRKKTYDQFLKKSFDILSISFRWKVNRNKELN